jgi:molybdopterin-synthase adenylyltransferase
VGPGAAGWAISVSPDLAAGERILDPRLAPVKPLLSRHHRVRFEPANEEGEEGLVFTCEARRVVIRGRSLREFLEIVVPLLDGRHTLDEIKDQLAEVVDPPDLVGTLTLLQQNRIVQDVAYGALPSDVYERLGPELSYLDEVGLDHALVVDRLAGARVAVVGVGGLGAVAATALAAAGAGHLRCVDSSAVSAADPYLTQLYGLDDVGRSRAEVTRDKIRAVSPATSVEVRPEPLVSDEDVANAVEGADFVLGCVDPGLASITYKLNRACLEQRTPWCSATVSAFDGIVGPTVIPYETACYLCYQGRVVACQDDPVDALADLRHQDESKTDTSPYRENLAFGAGIVGNLLALQAFQALTGTRPSTVGRILAVEFMTSTMSQHVVLRKPWCPACFPADAT